MPRFLFAVLLALLAVATAPLAAEPHSQAQQEQRSVGLSSGCTLVTLTFIDGTDAATVAAGISPPNALDAIWHLDNSTGSFQAFVPEAPEASDYQSVNVLDAVFLCMNATADISMPAVSPGCSCSLMMATPLSAGCNVVGLLFPDGTLPSWLASAVRPAGAFESMWRLDNATGSFEAYVASAPEASDLTSLQFLDAVFLCTAEPGSLRMPSARR